MKIIPYGRQSISEEDIEAVCSVLRSDWLTQGPKVREFEEALCARCGAKHCVVVANGTMALHLACQALEIGAGQVGLTSPISFMASANCIAYCGATPDFVDIDPETLCLSPEAVREYCDTVRVPQVVIPVDFAGIPAELPRFKELARRYGFRLIEDAAHAIGSTYSHDGRVYACGCCEHADLAIFSFHPVKTITTGEGGAVLTNDDELARRLRLLSNHGIERDPERFRGRENGDPDPGLDVWYHEMQALGMNCRITDIQCALGLSQLKRLERFKSRRQEIVNLYNAQLMDLAGKEIVVLPPWPDGTDPSFHLYPLRLGQKSRTDRDRVFRQLREKGIYTQVHYIPIYRQPFYREHYGYSPKGFPEAEKYFSSCLSLPLFPDLEDRDVRYVVEVLHSLL